MTWRTGVVFLALASALTACGSDDDSGDGDSGSNEQLEIIGEYSSNFGGDEIITEDTWESYAENEIVEYDNDDNVAILFSPDDEQYSRIVWTEPEDGSFYYCTTDFGVETLEEARELDTEADDSDPETGGCATFPWTKLTEK